jgi:hypothetical protein
MQSGALAASGADDAPVPLPVSDPCPELPDVGSEPAT